MKHVIKNLNIIRYYKGFKKKIEILKICLTTVILYNSFDYRILLVNISSAIFRSFFTLKITNSLNNLIFSTAKMFPYVSFQVCPNPFYGIEVWWLWWWTYLFQNKKVFYFKTFIWIEKLTHTIFASLRAVTQILLLCLLSLSWCNFMSLLKHLSEKGEMQLSIISL